MSWWNFWKRPEPTPIPLSSEEQAAALALKAASQVIDQARREIQLMIKTIGEMSPEEREAFRKWVVEEQKTL